MAEQREPQPPPARRVLNLLEIGAGDRVRLSGDATAEVVDNPRDGAWLQVRYLTAPADPELVGTVDLVFADDVLELL